MAEYGPKRYRLIFYGNLMPDTDPVAARTAVRRGFRLDDSLLEKCFSGRKVALRTGLGEAEAFRLQSRLEEIGLVTHLEQARSGGEALVRPGAAAATGPTAGARIPAPAAPDHALRPCRACSAAISPAAFHCRYCGARVAPPRHGWAWLLLPLALAAVLVSVLWNLLMPMWRDTTTAAHLEHAAARGTAVTRELRQFIRRTGFVPNSNLDAGLPAPEQLGDEVIAAIRVDAQGLVAVRFREEVDELGGESLLLVPRRDPDGDFGWYCDSTFRLDSLPPSCGTH